MRRYLAVLLCLVACSAPAQEIMYVSDVLTITMRTGQGREFQILRTISSGTRVEVIENSESGYSRVRLEGGAEGWVLSRYLVDTPIARDRLKETERRIEDLRASTADVRAAEEAWEKQRAELEDQILRLREDNTELKEELSRLTELTEEPRSFQLQNQSLKQEIENLRRETRLLHEKNNNLEEATDQTWFLIGGGVLFGGILVGAILARLPKKKSSSWDSF